MRSCFNCKHQHPDNDDPLSIEKYQNHCKHCDTDFSKWEPKDILQLLNEEEDADES